jgi:DNA-binding HxlR family transcriptional regulator
MRYDVFNPACPTRLVLDRLADKWVVLILARLSEEPLRFNEIRRSVGGVSQKVLSEALKRMERDGLVTRTVRTTVPVQVEYAITDLGRTLTATVGQLAHWAEENIAAVLEAQRRYDAAR